MLIVIAVVDFVAFYLHYLQHKIPILWEFHKVHHSPEVMHPLSNYREHPVDNIAYAVGTGGAYGIMMGLSVRFLGYLPSMPEIVGVPVILFLFNIAGYNMRHSHIWLRWPGRLSMIFPSPAHHHVHHSCHPDHLDKNFAFVFPVWDVLFKTYHMPKDGKDVKFGLYGQDSSDYSTCWRLYYIPFRNLFRKARQPLSTGLEKKQRQDKT
jgi:sterol desaturase/sphingolipid hydroxylase (fatty acid hydroxylase superfamily)